MVEFKLQTESLYQGSKHRAWSTSAADLGTRPINWRLDFNMWSKYAMHIVLPGIQRWAKEELYAGSNSSNEIYSCGWVLSPIDSYCIGNISLRINWQMVHSTTISCSSHPVESFWITRKNGIIVSVMVHFSVWRLQFFKYSNRIGTCNQKQKQRRQVLDEKTKITVFGSTSPRTITMITTVAALFDTFSHPLDISFRLNGDVLNHSLLCLGSTHVRRKSL